MSAPFGSRSDGPTDAAEPGSGSAAPESLVEDLIEDVSIDGMCGVY